VLDFEKEVTCISLRWFQLILNEAGVVMSYK